MNGLYTVANSAGATADNQQICSALQQLKTFMLGFDFIRMKPDKETVVGGWPTGVYGRGLSEPGRQYAFYHHHSALKKGGSAYIVKPGDYTETLSFHLPAGDYRADWVDPASGRIVRTESFRHAKGNHELATPAHHLDLALRIKRDSQKP